MRTFLLVDVCCVPLRNQRICDANTDGLDAVPMDKCPSTLLNLLLVSSSLSPRLPLFFFFVLIPIFFLSLPYCNHTHLSFFLCSLFISDMAAMLKRKALLALQVERFNIVNGRSWWDEIDESQKWQKGVFYTLCASYSIIGLVALTQLVRIQMRVPEYGWTTQKVFHLMNVIVNGLRAVLFGLYKDVFLLRPKALEIMLLDLPGLLFFSTYTLLVLFWAEIYHQARSLPVDSLRPSYYIVNGIVYVIQACIWIYMRISEAPVSVEVARLFFSVVSFCAALGFCIYGGRLFMMLRRFPIESRGRQNKLNEVGFVTVVCCSCFFIRFLVVGFSAFNANAEIDVLYHPILNLIYYMLVEIFPAGFVLYILRKLPPKRMSDQYHPIR